MQVVCRDRSSQRRGLQAPGRRPRLSFVCCEQLLLLSRRNPNGMATGTQCRGLPCRPRPRPRPRPLSPPPRWQHVVPFIFSPKGVAGKPADAGKWSRRGGWRGTFWLSFLIHALKLDMMKWMQLSVDFQLVPHGLGSSLYGMLLQPARHPTPLSSPLVSCPLACTSPLLPLPRGLPCLRLPAAPPPEGPPSLCAVDQY